MNMNKDQVINSPSYEKYWIYPLVGGAVCAVIGSAYYLYSLLTEDEENMEKEILSSLSQNNEAGIDFSDGELTEEKAYYVIGQSQKLTEEKYKQKHSELDIRRREAIDNEEQYMMLCNQTLECKQVISTEIMQQLMETLDLSEQKIQSLFQMIHKPGVNTVDMEKKIMKYFKFSISDQPDKEKLKKIIKYYADEFTTRLKTQITLSQNMPNVNNEFMQQKIMFDMIMIKTKVEDLMHINYNLSEFEMKYLLYEYKLEEDKDVKTHLEKINRIEEMFS